MPALARTLAAAAVTTAALTLAAGCAEQGTGASPTGEPAELTRQERLQLIWRGNVLSSDREAVCGQSGDQRTQSFRSFVDPWLTGLPPDSMPTDEDIVAFLDESCSTTGQG